MKLSEFIEKVNNLTIEQKLALLEKAAANPDSQQSIAVIEVLSTDSSPEIKTKILKISNQKLDSQVVEKKQHSEISVKSPQNELKTENLNNGQSYICEYCKMQCPSESTLKTHMKYCPKKGKTETAHVKSPNNEENSDLYSKIEFFIKELITAMETFEKNDSRAEKFFGIKAVPVIILGLVPFFIFGEKYYLPSLIVFIGLLIPTIVTYNKNSNKRFYPEKEILLSKIEKFIKENALQKVSISDLFVSIFQLKRGAKFNQGNPFHLCNEIILFFFPNYQKYNPTSLILKTVEVRSGIEDLKWLGDISILDSCGKNVKFDLSQPANSIRKFICESCNQEFSLKVLPLPKDNFGGSTLETIKTFPHLLKLFQHSITFEELYNFLSPDMKKTFVGNSSGIEKGCRNKEIVEQKIDFSATQGFSDYWDKIIVRKEHSILSIKSNVYLKPPTEILRLYRVFVKNKEIYHFVLYQLYYREDSTLPGVIYDAYFYGLIKYKMLNNQWFLEDGLFHKRNPNSNDTSIDRELKKIL